MKPAKAGGYVPCPLQPGVCRGTRSFDPCLNLEATIHLLQLRKKRDEGQWTTLDSCGSRHIAILQSHKVHWDFTLCPAHPF